MDPVTHLASGALVAMALPDTRRSRWFMPFALICAVLPDADVFFGATPLDYLTLHRGITHSFAGGAVMALLMALLFLPLLRRAPRDAVGSGGVHTWGYARYALAAYGLILLHIFLDCITTYGTQVFLPFSDYRVALPAVFIIDPVMTLVMLACIVAAMGRAHRRTFAALGLAWTLLWPGASLAVQQHVQSGLVAKLAAQPVPPQSVAVIPEALAPFNWKVVVDDGRRYGMARYQLLNPDAPLAFELFEKADPVLYRRLSEAEELFRVYGRFAMFMTQENRQENGAAVIAYRDLRFASTVPFMRMLRGEGVPFQLWARLSADGQLEGFRFVQGRAAGGSDAAGGAGGTGGIGGGDWVPVTR
ncbi:metal-dependent hydrolase [Nitratidesulfovibrio liaohensis]|uniref:Metal-dependent hydrolase n=1 Tax=Nitratidesulfovibrio liaohensis TaxID=2604158 RepID=A0ABY9QXZ7_9BACT|nr:metal-dependent hydrolase [Nitratidesulfovibrio liaohensis]WMW64054.1 metal-dependent hydrolase [Nitratidesulfovibrio liaohensis]